MEAVFSFDKQGAVCYWEWTLSGGFELVMFHPLQIRGVRENVDF